MDTNIEARWKCKRCGSEEAIDNGQACAQCGDDISDRLKEVVPDLVARLKNHVSMMAPHQREREAGRLIIESLAEIVRLNSICVSAHDRLLRADDDMKLLEILKEAWRGNGRQE